jgi:DNA ligase-1
MTLTRPMLAHTPRNLLELKFPLLASPKLDGVRALVVDGQLLSRKLKRIPNVHVWQHLARAEFSGYDGELVAGRATGQGVFHRTTSAVMSEGGTPQVTFWVFDRWDMGKEAYVSRIANLPSPIDLGDDASIHIRPLKHRVLRTLDQLHSYEESCLLMGYEGIMVRDPNGLYKQGRSGKTDKWLCKVKRFEDSEAEVTGIVEQMHNGNIAKLNELGYAKRTSHKANKVPKGTTGALQVRDVKTRVEFEIGTGMDDAQKAAFWIDPPIGKIIKYKFQPTGIKEKPRFPVFLGIRED